MRKTIYLWIFLLIVTEYGYSQGSLKSEETSSIKSTNSLMSDSQSNIDLLQIRLSRLKEILKTLNQEINDTKDQEKLANLNQSFQKIDNAITDLEKQIDEIKKNRALLDQKTQNSLDPNILGKMNQQFEELNKRLLGIENELHHLNGLMDKNLSTNKPSENPAPKPSSIESNKSNEKKVNPDSLEDKLSQQFEKLNKRLLNIETEFHHLNDLMDNHKEAQSNTVFQNLEKKQIPSSQYKANIVNNQLSAGNQKSKNIDSTINQVVNNAKKNLNQEISDGSVSLNEDQNILKMKINNNILFKSAEVSLSLIGEKTLQKIATLLKTLDNKEIYIIGHSDNVPISQSLRIFYPTNWELSAGRGIMVARYLIEELHLNPSNITAGGRSFYDPANKEEDAFARQENRRTEIWIYPKISEGDPISLERGSFDQEKNSIKK